MRRSSIKALWLAGMIMSIVHDAQAQDRALPVSRSCLVTIKSKQGEWVGHRSVSELNGQMSVSRDSYDWEPEEQIQFAPGMTFKWNLGYIWPADARHRKEIPEEEVMVSLHFWIEAQEDKGDLKKPESSFLHIYRSADPDERFSVHDISLTTKMFWHQFGAKKLSGKAVVPLDHILSFGNGFDKMVWNLRSAPGPFGGTTSFAKGVLPKSAMQVNFSEILKLRKLLDKKAQNFRKECAVPITVSMP